MPINLAQYRVTVGIFNNQNISRNLKFEEFPIWKCSNNLFEYFPICYSLLFYIFLCFLFIPRDSVLKITAKFCILIFILLHIFGIVFAWLCSLLVMFTGNVEVNPGAKRIDKDILSICHLNLNSISAYDYSKLFILTSYNCLHKFNIIHLSETYLDSNTPLNDDNLEISGYRLGRSDCPSNTKRGGICLYYKNNLPLKSYKYWLSKWMSTPWTYVWP